MCVNMASPRWPSNQMLSSYPDQHSGTQPSATWRRGGSRVHPDLPTQTGAVWLPGRQGSDARVLLLRRDAAREYTVRKPTPVFGKHFSRNDIAISIDALNGRYLDERETCLRRKMYVDQKHSGNQCKLSSKLMVTFQRENRKKRHTFVVFWSYNFVTNYTSSNSSLKKYLSQMGYN
jgi:hypothetical protein